MTDDEYNRMFGKRDDNSDHASWVLLAVGTLLVMLGVSLFALAAFPAPAKMWAPCDARDFACQDLAFRLVIDGIPVDGTDYYACKDYGSCEDADTACQMAAKEFDDQMPQWTAVQCEQLFVAPTEDG